MIFVHPIFFSFIVDLNVRYINKTFKVKMETLAISIIIQSKKEIINAIIPPIVSNTISKSEFSKESMPHFLKNWSTNRKFSKSSQLNPTICVIAKQYPRISNGKNISPIKNAIK